MTCGTSRWPGWVTRAAEKNHRAKRASPADCVASGCLAVCKHPRVGVRPVCRCVRQSACVSQHVLCSGFYTKCARPINKQSYCFFTCLAQGDVILLLPRPCTLFVFSIHLFLLAYSLTRPRPVSPPPCQAACEISGWTAARCPWPRSSSQRASRWSPRRESRPAVRPTPAGNTSVPPPWFASTSGDTTSAGACVCVCYAKQIVTRLVQTRVRS